MLLLKSLKYKRNGLSKIDIRPGGNPAVFVTMLMSAQFLKVSGLPQPIASVPLAHIPHMLPKNVVRLNYVMVQFLIKILVKANLYSKSIVVHTENKWYMGAIELYSEIFLSSLYPQGCKTSHPGSQTEIEET